MASGPCCPLGPCQLSPLCEIQCIKEPLCVLRLPLPGDSADQNFIFLLVVIKSADRDPLSRVKNDVRHGPVRTAILSQVRRTGARPRASRFLAVAHCQRPLLFPSGWELPFGYSFPTLVVHFPPLSTFNL